MSEKDLLDQAENGEHSLDNVDDDDLLNGDDSRSAATDDAEDIIAMRKRVAEMEKEAEKLREMQNDMEKKLNTSVASTGSAPVSTLTVEEKIEVDNRSIYIGNVDYGATAEELEAHFHGCGNVNRVTILCDKYTGHPKGFAYVEFGDSESVQTACALDESLFRGRQIKVTMKRTNKPGLSSTNRPPRGRGRGRGRFMGFRARGRAMYRPRRGAFYAPY